MQTRKDLVLRVKVKHKISDRDEIITNFKEESNIKANIKPHRIAFQLTMSEVRQ